MTEGEPRPLSIVENGNVDFGELYDREIPREILAIEAGRTLQYILGDNEKMLHRIGRISIEDDPTEFCSEPRGVNGTTHLNIGLRGLEEFRELFSHLDGSVIEHNNTDELGEKFYISLWTAHKIGLPARKVYDKKLWTRLDNATDESDPLLTMQRDVKANPHSSENNYSIDKIKELKSLRAASRIALNTLFEQAWQRDMVEQLLDKKADYEISIIDEENETALRRFITTDSRGRVRPACKLPKQDDYSVEHWVALASPYQQSQICGLLKKNLI